MKNVFAILCGTILLSGCPPKVNELPAHAHNTGAGTEADQLGNLDGTDRDSELAALAEELAPIVDELQFNFGRANFEYDSYKLTTESIGALSENARLLKDHPELMVRIEGHADKRGTIDYNLALGQGRAKAVRDALVAMGITPSRLPTLSYGEERPLAVGTGEEIWSANRRAEFTVLLGGHRVLTGG